MKVNEVMTRPAIHIGPEESAEVAARTLAQYNIGALPVCSSNGKLCGLITDRDLVTRCMASGKLPSQTTVRELMTRELVGVGPDTELSTAAELMGSRQVRRLPVVENGRLQGMVSLGDLAKQGAEKADTEAALRRISANIRTKNSCE